MSNNSVDLYLGSIPTEKCVELDLFTNYFVKNSGDEMNFSNSIALWDEIPKFIFAYRDQKLMRDPATGHIPSVSYEIELGDKKRYHIKIRPAEITEFGKDVYYLPSEKEEFVESAIREIFEEEGWGIHDPDFIRGKSWVRFSYRMIVEKLKKYGHSTSSNSVRKSLEIMSRTNISIHEIDSEYNVDPDAVWSGTIISEFLRVSRSQYLKSKEKYHQAVLPSLFTHAINCNNYRQINQLTLMSIKNALGRYIYRRINTRFISFKDGQNYKIKMTSLKNSGLLRDDDNTNRKNVRKAIESLKDIGFAELVAENHKRIAMQIVETTYTIKINDGFEELQKLANKRKSYNEEQLELAYEPEYGKI